VTRWNESVGPIASQPVGRNLRQLRRNRGGESTVGNLVADAMRAATGTAIAMQNSGGLRADLPEGLVTRGTIYEVMPFENTIVTMDLTGEEVRLALEQALRAGRVTQVSGIRYAFSLDRPPLDRVLWLRDTTDAPLDSARVYRVAVNNFMATGGDDYNVLMQGRRQDDTQIPVRDVLETFVAERCRNGGALDYPPQGRIVREGRRPERTTD
jgi:2',3'-cyclic-nucleotide 2'-phosphodiesterase (5'-nucleotidase family)